MINGEIDLSIGAVYLFAPFIFHEFHEAPGCRCMPALCCSRWLMCVLVGLVNGLFTDGRRHQLVHHHARDAARAAGLHADHLRRAARADARAPTCSARPSAFSNIFGGGTYSELIWALGDRDRAAARAELHALGRLHGRGRQQPDRRGGGRHQGPARDHPQLRPVRRLRAGLVGVLEAVRTTSVQPDPSGANEVLFGGIAAAVIGGTLLAGGSGTVVGGADRRAAARRPQRRADHQGRQRRLPELLPRPGDHHRDGGQHLRRAGAEG